jgi:type VI secretion system secreted protein VgrG
LSRTVGFHIDCLSEKDHINFDDAIGSSTLKMKMHGKERPVHASCRSPVARAQKLHYGYRILLRPWLWLLSRTSGCRIFQDKKASDIIEEVFQDVGLLMSIKLTEDSQNPKLEYCVQYRETDLNSQPVGIYYFFKHEGDKHTLVLADSKSSHSRRWSCINSLCRADR